MLFNANHEVRVKLTAHGRAVLLADEALLKATNPHVRSCFIPQNDAQGWSIWQLLGLMEAFGKHLVHGGDNLFEMEIEIPNSELDTAINEIQRLVALNDTLQANEKRLIDKLAPQSVGPADRADGPWHNAVLNQCMKVESCYVSTDPDKTLENLINYHVLENAMNQEPVGQFLKVMTPFGEQWLQMQGENIEEPGTVDLYLGATGERKSPAKDQGDYAAGYAQGSADANENAPWMSLAHMLCTDAGIEPGHLTERLTKLRDLFDAQKK